MKYLPKIDLKMWHMCVCMMKYHLTLKKKEILPFAITLMNLENIRLSEINQKQKKKYLTNRNARVCREQYSSKQGSQEAAACKTLSVSLKSCLETRQLPV